MDSLNALDLILEFYPDLIMKHSKQILDNFVNQISRRSTTPSSASADAAVTSAQRTLVVNPNSKLSSERGRNEVLKRLHALIQALQHQHKSVTGETLGPISNEAKSSLHYFMFTVEWGEHTKCSTGNCHGFRYESCRFIW